MDNVLIAPSSASDAVEVATDDVSGVQYQVIKIAVGSDGSAAIAGPGNGLHVADATPAITSIASDGITVATSSTLVVAANSGRTQITVINASDPSTGPRIWLGIGRPAVAGKGIPLDPGGLIDLPNQQAINALAESDTALATFEEWQ